MIELKKKKIIEKLIDIIQIRYNNGDYCDTITPNTDLYEEGYIDSIALEDFISYLENEFNLIFNEEYFFDERFASIGGLSEIILEVLDKKN